jgi:DnaJ-class molecular chaperone
MQKRAFYIALGIPRGVDEDAVSVAYRKVVTRYRRYLEPEDSPTEPPPRFAVLRSYSERRHAALFDEPEPMVPPRRSEVDCFFDGFVPEAVAPPRARRQGKDLYVELRMDDAEAQRGGLFPIHVPVVRRCPVCRDLEGDEAQEQGCTCCGGTRWITEDRMIEVTAPPGVRNGRVARVAMEDVGLGHTDLLVKVIIS